MISNRLASRRRSVVVITLGLQADVPGSSPGSYVFFTLLYDGSMKRDMRHVRSRGVMAQWRRRRAGKLETNVQSRERSSSLNICLIVFVLVICI